MQSEPVTGASKQLSLPLMVFLNSENLCYYN